ncbi:MAG TPA: PIN/TRAM domain-containing protein, partial [Prochlorococcus sp.]
TVVVTGALQTPTGRMVFGRLEKDQPTRKSSNPNEHPPATPR